MTSRAPARRSENNNRIKVVRVIVRNADARRQGSDDVFAAVICHMPEATNCFF